MARRFKTVDMPSFFGVAVEVLANEGRRWPACGEARAPTPREGHLKRPPLRAGPLAA